MEFRVGLGDAPRFLSPKENKHSERFADTQKRKRSEHRMAAVGPLRVLRAPDAAPSHRGWLPEAGNHIICWESFQHPPPARQCLLKA